MELMSELMNNQFTLYVPVAIVLIAVVLVFTFGFKSAEQPPFDKLSSNISDERKSIGKKRKTKEKKTANGFATPINEGKSEKSGIKDKEVKRSPAKEAPDTPKHVKSVDKKKVEAQKPKRIESVEDAKNKKNLKSKQTEKPSDYDDGNWETVPSKNDKKKKQDSPAKKDKKVKKTEKSIDSKEIEKLVKEEVDKQLLEDNKENKASDNIKKEIVQTEVEVIPVIEEKKSKIEKTQKKENVEVIEDVKPYEDELEKVTEVPKISEKKFEPQQAVTGPAFDELGDIWKEAKVVKKSKKKSRRD